MPKKLKHKLNWPALSTVDFNVVPDSTFNIGSGITTITPNLVSLLWGMPPDSYEANRILYPEKTVVNPYIGQNTIIYNPKTNNRDAVALDALHVMHDSPLYLELYQQYVQSLPKGFEPLMDAANDEFGKRGMTIIDKYQKGLPLSQEELEAIEPIYDALLRRQFAPDYMRNVPHGYQDKATLPVIESIGMSGDEAIRRYMESYPLKEVTVTANKKADGGELNTPLEWDLLSMKEKAAYIRMGVANGYKDIDSIRKVYNEFRKGGNTTNPPEPYIYEELPRLLLEAGLNVRVSSGYRRAGAVGTAGNRSWHPRHGAVDIVPQGNTTFEDIENALHNNPIIRNYMLSHNYGLLDESGRTPESRATMRRTGATGPHFHIGRDSRPAALYRQRVGALEPTDGRRVVYFTNPFLPLEDNTNIVTPPAEEIIAEPIPLPTNEAAIKTVMPDYDDIAGETTLQEVVVTGHRKPNLVAMLDFIDTVSNSTTPMQPIYQLQEPASTKNVMQLVNNDRVTLLQKDLEDRLLADERRRRLGYDYRDNVAKDIDDIRFYRNMAAEGGYLFPTGGPLITVNPGDRVFTDECALWSNSTLRDNGYLINGNAWNLGNVDMLYNGFEGLNRPETYDSKAVMDYNHQATLNVFKNFDSKTLDTKKPYVVNMFYNNSPSLETAYNEGDGVTGTHTGVLTYDEPTKKWWVTHNIHGNIHQEPFIDLQKNTGKYGVTAIYAPRPKTVWNRVKGFFGFEDGGPIVREANTYPGGGFMGMMPAMPGIIGVEAAKRFVRKRLYDNVQPWGYNDIPERAWNAVVKNKPEPYDDDNESRQRALRDDLWATYLQIPQSERHSVKDKVRLVKSPYKPKGAVEGKDTYRFKHGLSEPAKYGILAYAGQVPGGLTVNGLPYLPENKNRVVYPEDINMYSELEGLGQFTVGRGRDNKGEYVSFYDSWDLGDTNSPYKDMSMGIGKPFNIYDRIYLDDYYGVSNDPSAHWLPEVVITGRKKKTSK